MKRALVAGGLGALLLFLGVLGYRFFFPGPERVIRQRLTELAQTASFAPNEAPFAKLANAQKIGTFVAPDVRITVEAPGRGFQTVVGREDLVQGVMAVKSAVNALKVEFPDIQVSISPNRKTAVADVTVKANVAGERDMYVEEMNFTFEEINGKWLIRAVDPVNTLR